MSSIWAEAPPRRPEEIVLGKGATAHELLKIIYQCQNLPLHTRMRAAMACLPFETPKLGITYQASESDFATLLDQRIKRHQLRLVEHQSRLVEHQPQQIEAKSRLANHKFRRI
jgi:hypothetical protein